MDQQEIENILTQVGFVDISVERKPQSRDVIKNWLPGSGAEEYVVSANINARKPTEKERMAAFLNNYTKMQKEKDAAAGAAAAAAAAAETKNKESGHGHGHGHGSKSSGDAQVVEKKCVAKKDDC